MRQLRAGGIVAALVAASLVVPVLPSAVAGPLDGPTVGSSEVECGWAMYGRDAARTFDVDTAGDDCGPVIDALSAPTLVPAWFFKAPKTVTASPVVADGRVFVGDWTGTMYALDADTGDVLWSRTTEPAPGAPFGPIVSSAAVASKVEGPGRNQIRPRGRPARRPSRDLVVVGSGPRLYAFDAESGDVEWVSYFGSGSADPALGLPDDHPEDEQTEIESSPVIHDGVVIVGMDVHNRTREANNGVVGGVLAVDLDTGSLINFFDPEWDLVDADGAALSGCSSVWSSPTLNIDDDLLYFATGNCPHGIPAENWGRHTEAVSAISLSGFLSGQDEAETFQWSFSPNPGNQDDHDFGATPNLFVDADGRTVLGAAKKDGVYYALDPVTGEVLWSTSVVQTFRPRENFDVGGFIGSPATGGGNVFGGTAISGPPFFHSLDGRDGAVRWAGVAGPSYAASAHSHGVVVAGALDSALKVFEADTGALLYAAPLAGPISSGPAIVGDSIYIGSGTSSSDLCAKDAPGSEACFQFFDETLGATGGVHAFRLASSLLPAPVGLG